MLGILFFVGCSSDNLTSYTVGDDFVDSNIQIQTIDTFSINIGTFKQDSILTSSTGRLLLGSVVDEYLGTYTAQTFFQLKNTGDYLDDDAEYDSICFVMDYDDYYYADTTVTQTYKFYQISEDFESSDDEDDNFYNNNSLSYYDDVLGELEFSPRSELDTIYIPIDGDFGQELFDRIYDGDIETDNDFIEYYKGFTIKSEATNPNNQIMGYDFSTSDDLESLTALRLYYSIDNGNIEKDSYFLDFYINSEEYQFNSINTDFNLTSAEYPEGLTEKEITIYTEDSNDLFYVQGGTGVSTRIEFPSLRELKTLYETGTSLSAELVLYPLANSFDDEEKPLPSTLNVYIVDSKNDVVSSFTDADGNVETANLVQDSDEFENSSYYTLDMNGFVSQIVESSIELDYAIMLEIPNSSNSVDRVVFQKNDDVKLTVTYLNY